jgi:hypothetical protein
MPAPRFAPDPLLQPLTHEIRENACGARQLTSQQSIKEDRTQASGFIIDPRDK